MNFKILSKSTYILVFLLFFLSTTNQAKNKDTVNIHLETEQAIALNNKIETTVSADSDTIAPPHHQTEQATDDFEETNPSEDLYMNIWTRERLNPYKTPVDSIPDSISIDFSEFVFPKLSYVTSHFGPRWGRNHYGTDLKLDTGDSIKAAFSGKVRIIDFDRRGYGNYIVIRHYNGLETVYGHLSKVLVEHDQMVNAGDIIALGGSTGRSTGPHLHFEFRYLGNPIDTEHIVNYQDTTLKDTSLLILKNKMFNYAAGGQRTSAQSKYYVVRKGDTLGRIASRNGSSINNICRLNGISQKTKLRPGQRLRVR